MPRKSAPARPQAGKRASAPTATRPPRRRPTGALLIALTILALAALLGFASLQRVAPGERAYRVSRGGSVTRLPAGRAFVPPFLARLVRLPGDPMRVEGSEPLRSREGADLSAAWSIQAAIPEPALRTLLAKGGDPTSLLRNATGAALTRWAAATGGDSLILGEGLDDAAKEVETTLAAL